MEHEIHTTKLSDKEKYDWWQQIINQYHQSGQKQTEFCKANGLRLDHFCYRLKQWRQKHEPKTFFAPVEIANSTQLPLRLLLPNGCELSIPASIADEALYSLIKQIRAISC